MASTSSVTTSNSGTIQFSGLASGLQTGDIIDKLMSIESASQTKLKTQLTAVQAKVTAYQNVNTAFNDVKSAAQALNLGSYWKANSATSTSTGVTATATGSAQAGSFTFSVQQLAKANTVISGNSVASMDAPIDANGETLSAAIKRINSDTTLNYSATAVQVSAGNFKLQLTAKESGAANAASYNAADFDKMGAFTTVQAAQDAAIKVGSGAGAYSITSSTNTFNEVLTGVSMTVTAADPATDVTVKVGPDTDAITKKVKALVDSANAALSYIASNSKYDVAAKEGGIFQGNSTTSSLQTQLRSAISDIVAGAGLKLGANIGIDSTKDGSFTFDESKFKTAYAANPEGVASLFVSGGTTSVTDSANPGIAERLANVAKKATDSVSGMITTAMAGENTTIKRLQDNISDWDDRLAQRRQNLEKVYTALETAMSANNSTLSWLTGQISSLNNNNK